METITLAIAIGLIIAVGGAVWRLALHLRTIEKEVTNDTKHSLERIEDKIDVIGSDVVHIRERVSRLEAHEE